MKRKTYKSHKKYRYKLYISNTTKEEEIREAQTPRNETADFSTHVSICKKQNKHSSILSFLHSFSRTSFFLFSKIFTSSDRQVKYLKENRIKELPSYNHGPIRVVSNYTILPATYKPEPNPQRIDLTPWDLQFLLLGTIQKGILFDRSATYDHIHFLKTSLSRTLDYFYPLAGRLRSVEDIDKDAKLYYIECINGGVEFIEAVAEDTTLANILEPDYDVAVVRSLFPQNGLMSLECDVKPFMSIQVTKLRNGGCFIGCTLSHLFADGTSFWHFINSWSEICRGNDSISNPPVLERQYPFKSKIWIPNESIVRVKLPLTSASNLMERMFHLSKENISLLKLKAIEESGNHRISSLQAVLSHLWRSVSKSRRIDQADDVHFIISIGDRTRTEPPLSTHYFGNAIHLTKASLKCEEIIGKGGLGRGANVLNSLIAQQTGSVVMDFISSWIEKPALINIGSVVTTHCLAISSSPKFDVYGNDFGWGRPVAARSGGAHKMEGKVTVFTGVENGSMDLEVCLMAETLESLKCDSEFLGVGC